MGEKSPLFHSAIELLAHAIEHFAQNTERDRKLVVLHLANAIELILKDKLLDLGQSIYKNPKETKTIYGVFEDLKNASVVIPRKHILELLIDERNTIQHRFGSITDIMSAYYVENAIDFFDEFLQSEFGVPLKDTLMQLLTPQVLESIYPEEIAPKTPLQVARQVAQVHPSSGALTAWLVVERHLDELRVAVRQKIQLNRDKAFLSPYIWLRETLPSIPQLSDNWEKLYSQIRELSIIRNRIIHGRTEIDTGVAEEIIDKAAQVLTGIAEFRRKVDTLTE